LGLALELPRLGGGYPGKVQASGLNSDVFQQVLEDDEPPSGEQIATDIVAVAGMSPGDPDAVHSLAEGLQDKLGIHAPGAGNTDHSEIRGILHAAHPRQICGTVTAPVAEERDDRRVPFCHCVTLLGWYYSFLSISVSRVC
jgi:hypothetical protein